MDASRILVVDDDPALLFALTEALSLRMPSVRVDTSDSGAAALERLAGADYDAIVTDIKMPGMDGLTLLTEVRKLQPNVPTLLITGHGQHDLAVQALRGGAFDFIQKPLDRDYFVASLSRAIRVRQMGRQIDRQQRELEQHAARLEQTVEQRTRELREANQIKDTFLATLAHELRNPLAAIRSAIELLGAGAGQSAFEDILQAAERQVVHMTRLLDDLLDISRITKNKIVLRNRPLDLGQVVASAVNTIRPALNARGHTLVTRVADAPLPVDGDQTRLEQILLNLLDNAVKYTAPGGRVWLNVAVEDGQAVVEVRDSGIGIPEEMRQRIFQPFVQAEQSPGAIREGLGIGLALVHKLVELHGGKIQVASGGESGSTFTVRLPLLTGTAWNGEAETPAEISTRGRRVLLVDDNVTLTDMIGRLLSEYGHEVVAVAHDGPAAVEAARLHAPEFILLDVGLPGMDGYAVAEEIRKIRDLSDTVLVAVTGYGQEDDRHRAQQAGVDVHLVKPVSIQTLQELFARYNEQSTLQRH